MLYGAAQTAVLMKASTGNDKMREIAAAIQEGASAYLKRQYLTIGLVGVVILIAAYVLIGGLCRRRLPDRRRPVRRGRLCGNADFRSGQCPHGAGRIRRSG